MRGDFAIPFTAMLIGIALAFYLQGTTPWELVIR